MTTWNIGKMLCLRFHYRRTFVYLKDTELYIHVYMLPMNCNCWSESREWKVMSSRLHSISSGRCWSQDFPPWRIFTLQFEQCNWTCCLQNSPNSQQTHESDAEERRARWVRLSVLKPNKLLLAHLHRLSDVRIHETRTDQRNHNRWNVIRFAYATAFANLRENRSLRAVLFTYVEASVG